MGKGKNSFPNICIKRKIFFTHNIYRDETLMDQNPKISKKTGLKYIEIILK